MLLDRWLLFVVTKSFPFLFPLFAHWVLGLAQQINGQFPVHLFFFFPLCLPSSLPGSCLFFFLLPAKYYKRDKSLALIIITLSSSDERKREFPLSREGNDLDLFRAPCFFSGCQKKISLSLLEKNAFFTVVHVCIIKTALRFLSASPVV